MTGELKKRARSEKAKLDRREILLESALDVFSEKGFNNTKILNITAAAGLSTGTFYLYFKSKTDIYHELYSAGMNLLTLSFSRIIADEKASAAKKLTGLAKAYYKFCRENYKYFKILYITALCAEKSLFHEDERHPGGSNREKLLEIIRKILVNGIESGEVKTDADPWKTAVSFWAAMDGIMFLNENGDVPFSSQEHRAVFEQMLGIIISGISENR